MRGDLSAICHHLSTTPRDNSGHLRHAFHFVDRGDGWDGLDRPLLAALVDLHPRRNFVVSHGNVVHWDFGKSGPEILNNALRILTESSGTIDPEPYVDLITTKRPYVQLVQGLSRRQAGQVHRTLTAHPDYVGFLELHFDNSLQWVVYGTGLPDAYRLVGSELRIRWRSIDGEEAELVTNQRLDEWGRSGLFGAVALEDLGLRSTIFDAFESPEHAALEARTHEMLSDLLAGVANEVLLRAIDLDPRLVEGLHAVLQSLSTAKSSEELAQAALSCRRFLERFADRVFPPTTDLRKGRELGAAQWKNRLWAYAEDALGSANADGVDERLKDIGSRIDSVASAANAGVHRPEVEEVAIIRLVVGLTSLVFDLCLISPPPYDLPGAGYEVQAMAMIRDMVGRQE